MQPSERPCSITWRQEPPTPAQLAAWRQLWTRLLGDPAPPMTEALGVAIPRASRNNEPDCADQAAATASTSPRLGDISHADRV